MIVMFQKFLVALAVVSICFASSNALAQASIDLRGNVGGSGIPGGSIIPGFDSAACDSSIEGAIRYNSGNSEVEFCNGSDWAIPGSGGAPTPTGCSNVGDTCDDGSIYVGLSPDGDIAMYTTPADGGTFYWNNNTGYSDTVLTNCTDDPPGTASTCQTGESNTTTLVAADSDDGTGGTQPHLAAEYCDTLTAHGYDDWYLPAQDELAVIYTNRSVGSLNGTFDTSFSNSGYYWSSSEEDTGNARNRSFANGAIFANSKDALHSVRCVRK